MAKMEKVLREEISRLARREIRSKIKPLNDEVSALKKTVRELKREVQAARSDVQAAKAARQTAKVAPAGASAVAPGAPAPSRAKTSGDSPRSGSRLSPGLIKKLRKRLGISQEELALLVQVSKAAVSSWEQDRANPRPVTREAIIALRDMTPKQVKAAVKSLSSEQPASS